VSTALGLDFAGYSSGKTGLARARLTAPGQVTVTVFVQHSFSQRLTGSAPLSASVPAERAALQAYAAQGPILVDLPLDLENLPAPATAEQVWELVQRPVDYALDAMAPLANLIGAPVARFQYLLAGLPPDWVGTHLFETYPALMLELLGLRGRGYKAAQGSRITFAGDTWHGSDQAAHMAANATQLGWTAAPGTILNDDQFDAVLCALTGIAPETHQLRGSRLDAEITRRIQAKTGTDRTYHAPASFVLLESWPDWQVHIQMQTGLG
jgi:hypothetical protein